MRGKLIVLEGIDCSGKTTQCKALQKRMGCAVFMSFPRLDNGSISGTQIKERLARGSVEQTLIELFAENRKEENARIEKFLEGGTDVIIDRYSFSGIAYGMVNCPQLSLKSLVEMEMGTLKPDLVIWLKIDPNISSQRPEFGKGANETLGFQVKVAQAYQVVYDFFNTTHNWWVIDATLPQEVITEEILNAIEKLK